MACWDKECKTLYRSFTRAPVGTASDKAVSSLLSRLQQKKQERWEEAVNYIDFSHSSRKAWKIIIKLTGRSGRSFHQSTVAANSIAMQLVKKGHTEPGTESPPGWSTRSPPSDRRFQYLRVTLSLNPLDWSSLLLPSDA